MTSKTEETWYVVPEVEIRIHSSWIELVKHCQDSLRHGSIKFKINNAIPGKIIKETPKIRFDVSNAAATKQPNYYIESIDIKVPVAWVNLVSWAQNYFVAGAIELKIVNACPTELISAEQDVRFDKPETIPPGLPLKFGCPVQ